VSGDIRHHLIDPRTGLPVANDIASVTVIGPSVTVAEVWAKALLVAGREAAPSLLKRRTDCCALIVGKYGHQDWLNGMERYNIDA
jgi:thiamine biosynthesis lipoprotein